MLSMGVAHCVMQCTAVTWRQRSRAAPWTVAQCGLQTSLLSKHTLGPVLAWKG